jgi:hypothetical protein
MIKKKCASCCSLLAYVYHDALFKERKKTYHTLLYRTHR